MEVVFFTITAIKCVKFTSTRKYLLEFFSVKRQKQSNNVQFFNKMLKKGIDLQ